MSNQRERSGQPGVAKKVTIRLNSADDRKPSTGKREEILTIPTEGRKSFILTVSYVGNQDSAKFCNCNRGKVENVAGQHDHKVDPMKTREFAGNRVTDKPNQGYGFKDKGSSQNQDNVASCMVVDRSPDVERDMTKENSSHQIY